MLGAITNWCAEGGALERRLWVALVESQRELQQVRVLLAAPWQGSRVTADCSGKVAAYPMALLRTQRRCKIEVLLVAALRIRRLTYAKEGS